LQQTLRDEAEPENLRQPKTCLFSRSMGNGCYLFAFFEQYRKAAADIRAAYFIAKNY